MHKIVAFTGAGISKASGVPTFEEMGDLRYKLSRDYFNAKPEGFYEILLQMKKTTDKAEPNPAHLALAHYDVPVVTMNIDGLHGKAGSRQVIEIHGSMEKVYCPQCRERFDLYIVEDSIYCPHCSTLLQTEVVLYGDSMDKYHEALELILSGEELLVVGTSFQTSTASQMVSHAQWAGKKVTIINSEAEIKVPEFLKKALA